MIEAHINPKGSVCVWCGEAFREYEYRNTYEIPCACNGFTTEHLVQQQIHTECADIFWLMVYTFHLEPKEFQASNVFVDEWLENH